jgi:hypothetical protein
MEPAAVEYRRDDYTGTDAAGYATSLTVIHGRVKWANHQRASLCPATRFG